MARGIYTLKVALRHYGDWSEITEKFPEISITCQEFYPNPFSNYNFEILDVEAHDKATLEKFYENLRKPIM